MSDSHASGFVEGLRAGIGRSGPVSVARDAVNPAMIRHWCDAMEDDNPLYTDPDAAARSLHGGLVAPPAMLMAWSMRGLERPTRAVADPESSDLDSTNPDSTNPDSTNPDSANPASADPGSNVYRALDAAGFTSVVATNSEHEYLRYLRLGDELHSSQVLEDVSEEKKTALGVGHFVTTRTEYRDQAGETVGRMLFRILKFKPGTGRGATAEGAGPGAAGERPQRPKPGVSRDTAFFWQGLEVGELRIQQCTACSKLHHPPMVRCPECGSYELGWIQASGRGTVYSHVEPVHPRFAAFEPPYVVGLVELEEGTRLLTNIVDVDPEAVRVGMPLELVIRRQNSEIPLPLFRPIRPPRRETTLARDAVQVGDELAPCPIPITATLIVATAIASRDYQDVHHDRELAMERGSPDIFMNILTTTGLCARYVTDWAGPEALVRKLSIQLGVPNYPHDTMTMTGSVLSSEGGRVEVGVRGYNRMGNHVTGRVELELPAGDGG